MNGAGWYLHSLFMKDPWFIAVFVREYEGEEPYPRTANDVKYKLQQEYDEMRYRDYHG
jgi:hypothetical protein